MQGRHAVGPARPAGDRGRQQGRSHHPAPGTADDQRRDDVLELPDVARPVVAGQRLQGRSGGRGPAPGERLRPLPEVVDEEHDVVAAVPERRHLDAEHVEPVQQVHSILAGPDVALEGSVGGRDDPHVDRARHRVPHAANLAVLQHAQQLGLRTRRQLPHLVEEQRAPVARLEQTRAVGHGAGERPPDVAEELGLDEIVGEGGAVDGLETALGPAAQPVHAARDQLLAGAALARHEDRKRRLGDPPQAAAQAGHRVAPAQESQIVRMDVASHCSPPTSSSGRRRRAVDHARIPTRTRAPPIETDVPTRVAPVTARYRDRDRRPRTST